MQSYSVEDLKKMLHVSNKTLQLYRDYGILKARKTGRSWLTTENEFKRFLEITAGADISTPKAIEAFAKQKPLRGGGNGSV